MSQKPDQLRLDGLAVRYLEATERGDLDAIADLWIEAASDPNLEVLLHELNEELARSPSSRRRPLRFGLAAALVAACVAALIFTISGRRGALVDKTDPQIPIASGDSARPPLASGAMSAAPLSHASLIAHLIDDQDGTALATFTWPFDEMPILKESSVIPTDLLN
jgi:hypothetical protein